MRDPDGWTYFKEEVGGLVVGGFEPEAKPWVAPDEIPYPFEFQLLDEDWEHFSVLMDEALRPHPGARARPGSASSTTAPRASRPTTSSCSGEAPGLRGLLRRRRLQLGRHRVGGRRRPGAGRVGRRGRADHGPDRRRRPPVRAVRRRQRRGCAAGWPRSSACTTPCRGPTASPRPRRDVRLSPLHDRLGGGRRRASAPADGLGAAATSSRRPGARARLRLGQARLARPGRPPSSVACRDGRRGLRPDVVLASTSSRAATRSPRCSGSAPPTSTSRSGTCVYTPLAQRARHATRPT